MERRAAKADRTDSACVGASRAEYMTHDNDWIPNGAGIEDVRLHDLRHTYASIALMHGETVLTIGRLLGHDHPGTTLKYTNFADAAAREAVDTVSSVLRRV